MLHSFFFFSSDLLLLLISDLLIDFIKSFLMLGQKLLKSQHFHIVDINLTRFRYLTGHGSRLIFHIPSGVAKNVLTPFGGQHTNAHECAA